MRPHFFLFAAIGLGALIASSCARRDPGVLTADPPTPAGHLILVDVYARWCEPCRRMEQTWSDPSVAAAIGADITFQRIDADEHVDFTERHAVYALPVTLALVDAREVDRLSGYAPPETLVAFIRSAQRGVPARDRLAGALVDAQTRGDAQARSGVQQEFLALLARSGDTAAELDLLAMMWLEADTTTLVAAHRATRALRARAVDLAPLIPTLETLDTRARAGNAKARGAWAELASAMGRSWAVADALLSNDGAAAKAIADNSWTYTLPVRLAEDNRGAALLKLVDLSSPSVGSWAEFFAGDDRSRFTPWQRAQADRTRADDIRTLVVLRAACLAAGRTNDAAAVERALLARFPEPAAAP